MGPGGNSLSVSKIVFLPFAVIGGLLSGVIGKRAFRRVWALVDSEEPPDPTRRDTSWGKLILALVLEGAIFRAVRGIVDRASRQGVSRLTGSWPGASEMPSGGER
jgi:Protein of unknown function (DUF4235)